MFKPITHVIFDLDGLLLDTESLNEKVNQEIAQRYGKTFDTFVKLKIAGRPTVDSAKIVIDLLNLPLTIEEYLQERNKLLYPLYSQVKPLPGAINLTQNLHKQGIPQAIATSSSLHNFEMKTTHYQEWIGLFTEIIVGDDPAIKQGKPAPDIFLLAAQRLNASVEHCLVFEDSLAGMQAALSANMSVITIPPLDFDRSLYQDATQTLDSLSEFQPQLWHLPEFD
ncbi:MAG: HAD-IA family hydrolase [Xenococcaceae cyanobacterium]